MTSKVNLKICRIKVINIHLQYQMINYNMNRIHIYRLGLATGVTLSLLYAGCIIVLSFVERETTISFFNTVTHIVDFSSILRTTAISVGEAITGIIEWFIIGWLSGASIAAIYNFSLYKDKAKDSFKYKEKK